MSGLQARLTLPQVGALLLVSGACGRFGFETDRVANADAVASDGALVDAAADGPGPDASGGLRCPWLAPHALVAGPTEQVALNSGAVESDGVLSADQLTLFYTSQVTGNAELYRAIRPNLAAAFVPDGPLPFNTSLNEEAYFEAANGREAFFTRGIVGNPSDIQRVTRATVFEPWSDPVPVAELNTPSFEFDPVLAPDGLTLWFSGMERDGSAGGFDIFSATRPSPDGAFGPVVPWPHNTPGVEGSFSLTPDGLVAVFAHSDVAGSSVDVFVTRRPSLDAAFATPQLVPGINLPDSLEAEPSISADGCTLVFVSDRAQASDWDLYLAEFAP